MGNGVDYDEVYAELKKEYPNQTDLILSLFELFGSGFGVWNGFPAYETLPKDILLGISIELLNKIEEKSEFTHEQLHGMARFYAGWDFHKNRKADINGLSSNLKNQMLEHLIEFGDDSKLNQFNSRVIAASN